MFVGIKNTERLQDQLDASSKSMKAFFQDNNPEFLQIMTINGSEYIGKIVAGGASLENLGNVFMNVRTMLKMICPGYLISDDAIKIMALDRVPSSVFY